MQSASSYPAPDRGGGVKTPRPAIVPAQPVKNRPILMWAVVIAVVVVAGGIGLFVRSHAQSKTSGGGPVISVASAVVGMGDLNASIRVNGTVAAKSFAALLAPRITGSRSGINRGGDASFGGGGGNPGDFTLILLHLAKAGVHVKTGDVVAEFDPQFQLQRLDDYKDSVVQLENSIKKMTANLAATKEAHDQTVRSAKANWDKAILDLQTADVRSQIDAEKYKLAVEEADATYKQLVFESSLVDESQLAAIRASALNLDQSKIELKRAEVNVQRMTVKSPMDGIVVMASIVRNGEFGQIREGDQVNAGQPFVTIVDPTSMVLNATVNQVDAERLRLGMKATVRLDAYNDVEMPGSLLGIGAMSKTSAFRGSYVGEIPIRIKIEKTDPRLIPDLTGSAEVVMNAERNILVAPLPAVFDEGGGPFVFLQGPEGWLKRKVDLGLSSFTNVAVRSGLQSGDVVALQRPM
jgi:HlyD family secretion protein